MQREVSRSRVVAPGSHLTCDATQHPSPLPSRDQECAKSPTGLCQVGLYIGSMCNREGCSIFAASSPPIVWGGGEDIFETKHRHHK